VVVGVRDCVKWDEGVPGVCDYVCRQGFLTGFSSSMLHMAMKKRVLILLNGLTCLLYESIVCRIEATKGHFFVFIFVFTVWFRKFLSTHKEIEKYSPQVLSLGYLGSSLG
jgi:hypothetical protein